MAPTKRRASVTLTTQTVGTWARMRLLRRCRPSEEEGKVRVWSFLGEWKMSLIRRPRSAGRAPGKPSVPFLGTFRESGELLCKKRVLVLPQHSSKVRT